MATTRRSSSKRELINTGRDKRLVRRDSQGQFKESDNAGHSLAQDRRKHAKSQSKSVQGERGDRRRTATVTLDLPPEVFSALRRTPDEFVRELRIAGAIYWYSRGEISQEKAAQIAGVNRVAFMDELAKRKIDAFVVDPADLQRELDRG